MPPRAALTSTRLGLTLASSLVADQAEGLRGLRQVHGDEVGLARAARRGRPAGRPSARRDRLHVGVVGDHLHAERASAAGRRARRSGRGRRCRRSSRRARRRCTCDALPLAVLERRVRRGDVAGGGEHQRHRELGGADDVGGRGVDHHHAGLGRGLDVDVVEADTGAGDDLEQPGARPGPRRRPGWRERTSRASTSASAGSSSARSAPSRCRTSKSGPSASTVAGLSSSAMSTTGCSRGGPCDRDRLCGGLDPSRSCGRGMPCTTPRPYCDATATGHTASDGSGQAATAAGRRAAGPGRGERPVSGRCPAAPARRCVAPPPARPGRPVQPAAGATARQRARLLHRTGGTGREQPGAVARKSASAARDGRPGRRSPGREPATVRGHERRAAGHEPEALARDAAPHRSRRARGSRTVRVSTGSGRTRLQVARPQPDPWDQALRLRQVGQRQGRPDSVGSGRGRRNPAPVDGDDRRHHQRDHGR